MNPAGPHSLPHVSPIQGRPRPGFEAIVAILGVKHAQRDVLPFAQNRMLARNALALLLATAPATATTAESDSQSANSIMPGCNAWIAQLSRGSRALGSNVFLAGECLASSAPSYISHAIFLIHRPPARLPT